MDIEITGKNIKKAITLLAEKGITFKVKEEKKEGLNIPQEFTDFIEDYPIVMKRKCIYVYYVMLDIYTNWGSKYKTIRSYSSFYSTQTGLSRGSLAPAFEVLRHGGFMTTGFISVEGKNWDYSTATFIPKGDY